jgi:hypothetical protein
MRSKHRYSKKRQKKNKRTRRLKGGNDNNSVNLVIVDPKEKAMEKAKEYISKLRDIAHFKKICSDSGVCIAFGTEKNKILDYFSNFTDFSILQSVKQIGASSANGIVMQFEYIKKKYTAHTVLKMPINNTSDNVMYEALVGFFLNEQSLRFPSFLETYGLYNLIGVNCFKELIKINEDLNILYDLLNNNTGNKKKYQYRTKIELYEHIKKEVIQPKIFKCMKISNIRKPLIKSSQIDKSTINDACKNPTNYAVLIQHLKGVNTLWDMLQYTRFLNNDLIYILFQVYMTLSSLSKVFTHYDLHTNNVLVYEPVNGSYIEYHYHIGSEIIIFKSRYIAKIIDYGQCYFEYDNISSKQGNTDIMKSAQFNEYTECKSSESLESFSSEFFESYRINSAIKNESHDLILIQYIKNRFKKTPNHHLIWIHQMPPIIFGKGMNEGYEEFGTEENDTSGLPNQINNVTDAFLYLKDVLTTNSQRIDNDVNYHNIKKLGDLHIFDDSKPMEYKPFSEETTTEVANEMLPTGSEPV